MNKFLTKLFLSAALAFTLGVTANAQQMMKLTSLSAATAANVLSGPFVIDNFVVVNSTTNNATVYFYDSSTTATNYIAAAYTSFVSYATNYSVVWTNSADVLVTNTFAGTYTGPVANALATNTLPNVQILIVPAGATLNKDVRLQSMRGLTAYATQALTLLTTYRLP